MGKIDKDDPERFGGTRNKLSLEKDRWSNEHDGNHNCERSGADQDEDWETPQKYVHRVTEHWHKSSDRQDLDDIPSSISMTI